MRLNRTNNSTISMLSQINKVVFFIFCIVPFLVVPLKAQDESLELTDLSDDPSTDIGPVTSTTVTFLYNEDNDSGTTYTPYFPETTVTFEFTSQEYTNVTQDSGNNGGDPSTADSDPAAVIGWTFNEINGGGDLIRNGEETEINSLLSNLSQSIPASNNFSSTADTPGTGIDAGTGTPGTGINTAVFMSVSFEPLRGLAYGGGARYLMGELTITFNHPVDDPVLHFVGLGGVWSRDTGSNRYVNTATMEFELVSSSPGLGSLSLSRLSGTDSFEVVDGTKLIRNNSPLPDFENTPAISSGVGTGSALVEGTGVTELTFNLYARSMTDAGRDNANLVTEGDPEFGNPEWGWAGNGTPDFPNINFSADRFMIGVSTQVEPDEVELTQGDSYRMLTSPIVGTSYDDLIGSLWTQGASQGLGYDTDAGDPNIFTWSIGEAEDSGWASGFDLNSNIPTGEGFLMTVFEADDYETGTGSFPKTLSLTGSEAAPPIVVSDGGGDSDGWLLLGNPFKEPIDISELLNNRITNLEQVIYVWDRGIGEVDDNSREPGWRFSALGSDPTDPDSNGNPMLGNIENDVLMPFQGFFIQKSSSGNSSVTFDDGTEGSRDDLTTNTTGTFYRKEKAHPNTVVLDLNGESLSNSLWLTFSDNGSLDKLRNDALEMASLNEHYAIISTKKTDGDLLTLSQLPIPDDNFEIPVSVEATRPGNYTITASDFNLSMAYDLYLIDLEEDENIRIDKNFEYTFTINQAAKANPTPMAALTNGPQKAKNFATTDRFVIATQPRDFVEIPASVALSQNYPNPFNPTTQISYNLPQQSDVQLEVYDLVGRQVATLVNQSMEAGSHTVNFNASNLSSGVYIYRLNAGSTVLSRKLTVIK